jgi:hypothetical protein
MPHLPPAHHETSKRDSPNETDVKEKQNKTIPNSNSNLAKSITHHNQTKELTTWFLKIASKVLENLYHHRVKCIDDFDYWKDLRFHSEKIIELYKQG